MGEAPVAQAPAVDLMKMNRDARCKQVLVTSLINGTPMRMMLDTGATHTVLHTESAARVPNAQWIDTSHIQFKGNSAQRPKLLRATLLAGPAESPGHPVMVMNLGAVRSMMAEPVDGILGMDLLSHIPFTFDLKSGELYWEARPGRNWFRCTRCPMARDASLFRGSAAVTLSPCFWTPAAASPASRKNCGFPEPAQKSEPR